MAYRSESDFAHFYATALLKELKQLDVQRQVVLKKVMVAIAVVAGLVAVCITITLSFRLPPNIIMFSLFGGGAIGAGIYRYLIRGYVHEFKLRIIKRIIEFVDPALVYSPKGYVSKVQFNSSRIFQRYPDRMRGDDLVEGKIGKTDIAFSEVHAEYRTHSSYRRGGQKKRYHTIFKGLFFKADFNKTFYGKTVVLPDTAEKMFGSLGSFFQKLNWTRGDFIKLDDPEFERYFVVYADDQIESRYILSPSLMKRIVDFRKKTGKRIFLSFVGSEVFVAVPYKRGLFEPKVFTSITGFKSVKEYFEDLQLTLGIVEDLDLNTRIWSKKSDPPNRTDQKPPPTSMFGISGS
jgi:hypothetical protein